MSDEIVTLKEWQERWDSQQGPVMNEVLDFAYEKLGNEAVNCMMQRVADHLSDFTGVEIGWHNVKDGCSWQHTNHGTAFFKMRKPRPAKRE